MFHQGSGQHGVAARPLRDSRGGYLRSPFEVNLDTVFSGGRGGSASLPPSTSAASGNRMIKSEVDIEARPWQRAGVGASKLSAKERLAQIDEAKKIYGDDDGMLKSMDKSESYTHQSVEELNLLRKIVPRKAQDQKKTNDTQTEGETEEVAAEQGVVASSSVTASSGGHQDPRTSIKRPREEALPQHVSTPATAEHSDTKGSVVAQQRDGNHDASPRTTPPPHPTPVVPMGKRQEMEAKRLAALFGSSKQKGKLKGATR